MMQSSTNYVPKFCSDEEEHEEDHSDDNDDDDVADCRPPPFEFVMDYVVRNGLIAHHNHNYLNNCVNTLSSSNYNDGHRLISIRDIIYQEAEEEADSILRDLKRQKRDLTTGTKNTVTMAEEEQNYAYCNDDDYDGGCGEKGFAMIVDDDEEERSSSIIKATYDDGRSNYYCYCENQQNKSNLPLSSSSSSYILSSSSCCCYDRSSDSGNGNNNSNMHKDDGDDDESLLDPHEAAIAEDIELIENYFYKQYLHHDQLQHTSSSSSLAFEEEGEIVEKETVLLSTATQNGAPR